MVEQREGPRGSFGLGRRVAMRFADFLGRVGAGDATLYMTTQEVRSGWAGRACQAAPLGLTPFVELCFVPAMTH